MKGDLNFKPKIIFVISAIFYLLIGLLSGFFGWRNSDTGWIASVASLLTLDPYSSYRLIGVAPPLGAGFVFPPLLLFIVSPFIILGRQFGWTNEFTAKIYGLPLFLVDIFNIYLIMKIILYYRPKIPPSNLNFIILVLFFSGYFLFTSAFMGHPETLVVLFSILGINSLLKKKFYKCGIFFGLSLLAKQSAIFIIIPVLFYLLIQERDYRYLLKVLGATVGAFLLPILPFFITHPVNTWYGIMGFSQKLIIWGPNFWWFIGVLSRNSWERKSIEQFLITVANPFLFGLVILMSVIILLQKKIDIKNPNFFGFISASLLLFAIFSKYLSFHHFLPGFVFIMIWDTLRSKVGFPVFGVTYAFLLFTANFIGNPFWQPLVLIINILGFIYIWYSICGVKLCLKFSSSNIKLP